MTARAAVKLHHKLISLSSDRSSVWRWADLLRRLSGLGWRGRRPNRLQVALSTPAGPHGSLLRSHGLRLHGTAL